MSPLQGLRPGRWRSLHIVLRVQPLPRQRGQEVRGVQRQGVGLRVNPLLDLGTAGSVASVLSLVIGFLSGLWWRHVRTLIARDREATVSLLGLYEVFRYLQRAEQVLGGLQIHRSADRRTMEVKIQEAFEIQQARDGVIKSLQALNTFFGIAHDLKVSNTDPLVRAARFYKARGPLRSAVICFEQALALSEDGKKLGAEDRRACVHGLQYCAVALGERDEAARWSREAKEREIDGCIPEERIQTWFVVYRCAALLRLTFPNPRVWQELRGKRSLSTLNLPRK